MSSFNNRFKKMPVSQNSVKLFFLFLLKIGLVGPIDQQIKLVPPNYKCSS